MVLDRGRIIVFPGGLPLKDGDDVIGAIGAIGVSGGAVEQDQAVAESRRSTRARRHDECPHDPAARRRRRSGGWRRRDRGDDGRPARLTT